MARAFTLKQLRSLWNSQGGPAYVDHRLALWPEAEELAMLVNTQRTYRKLARCRDYTRQQMASSLRAYVQRTFEVDLARPLP